LMLLRLLAILFLQKVMQYLLQMNNTLRVQ
jgi:hypothetical protein